MSQVESLLPSFGFISGFIEIAVKLLKEYYTLTPLQRLWYDYKRLAEDYNYLVYLADSKGMLEDYDVVVRP